MMRHPILMAAAICIYGMAQAGMALAAAPLTSPRPADRAGSARGAALERSGPDEWVRAAARAIIAGPIAEEVVIWDRLRQGEGDWHDYADFVQRRGDWPDIARLHRQGEAAIADGAPAGDVISYFETRDPATGTGVLALIDAFEAQGRRDAAIGQARRAWRMLTLDSDTELKLLDRYGAQLAPHHEDRLDRLLWERQLQAAERMLDRVSSGWQRLGRARLALARREQGVDARVAAVPADLANHPGLLHARFDWRMRRGFHDSAADLMVDGSGSATALGRPEAWARDRNFLARQALSDGRPRDAYRYAANHHVASGARFAELEWLSGYIALRRLDDPQTALGHFRTLGAGVSTPISLGRAAYWEARALMALDRREDAEAAYARAAQHQTSFYGLLAAEEAGLGMDPALAQTETFPHWSGADFSEDPLLRAGVLLHRAGRWHDARRFFLHLSDRLDRTELGQLADMVLGLGEPNFALVIAKRAAARGHILPHAYFPMGTPAEMDLPIPPELALAIARRESEFDPGAVSPAGALGMMQLLPGTAELMAGRTGLSYSRTRLTTDPEYNTRLGAAYMAQLIREFGDSVILISAAYNAGPGRPRRWIQDLGDPRDPGVDPIDGIENVPFAETRSYIMRVMESLIVYRARLAGEPVPLRMRDELAGR